jgi:hypothetical protein
MLVCVVPGLGGGPRILRSRAPGFSFSILKISTEIYPSWQTANFHFSF